VYLPKYNIEAEQSVLGAVLIDNNAIKAASELLTGDDFYKESHRRIFTGMTDLCDRSEPIDIVTLAEHLSKKNDLEVIGGPGYLTSLAMTIPTAANIKYHASIVAEASRMRSIQRLCMQTLEDISSGNLEDAEAATAQIHSTMSGISHSGATAVVDMKAVMMAATDSIDRRYANRESISGITSGLRDVARSQMVFSPQSFISSLPVRVSGKALYQ
jgi:replicative DNA helicase